ncbi:MAG: sorbitol-6-phosphate dehydrogenase [Caldilineaceae bacterium]|nr:sorbitol-6-phosphate dehydrogenase [Caldilineaceae bacterium]
MHSQPLLDQVAVVTGAAQGLGAAIVRRLADEGAHVVVGDLNAEGAQATAAEVAAATGRRTLAAAVDVTQEEQVEALFARTLDQFGRLDLVVANAGIVISGPLVEFDLNRWRKVVDVNLTGYFLCAKHAARIMIEQRRGVILQINSKSGKKGSYKNSAYAAGKFGGVGLTQSLALELAEYGIRVNAICPGNLLDSPLWVDSLYGQYAERLGITVEEVRRRYVDQVPMKRGCTYQDVTNVVVFLASDQASYMTGQAINVTGGQEMG